MEHWMDLELYFRSMSSKKVLRGLLRENTKDLGGEMSVNIITLNHNVLFVEMVLDFVNMIG